MTPSSIADVLALVRQAGRIALEAQTEVRRGYKADGSVVTEADRRVENYLFEHIAAAYPQANVVTEETARAFDSGRGYTFAVDPIDGSDVYSQGMAGWSVSVGLLDAALTPVAGVVFAPRLDLLLFADVGRPATLNGVPITPPHPAARLTPQHNVMVTSRLHHTLDLRRLPCKIRSIGSAALHLSFPAIYAGVFGAVEGPGGHIWDIAGAHAVTRSLGHGVKRLSGGEIDYSPMMAGGTVGDVILSGHRQHIDALRKALIEG